MKAIKVLGIAPYLGLKKLLETTARQQPDIQLTCFVGDLEAGLDIAVREIEQHEFDIIISRGGTATLLKEHMTLPVIDVGVSQYDIMQMLQSSREYMGKRALVGFQSITTSAGVVAEILQDDIAIFTIHQQNEVRGLLQVLKSEGFDTVLGDMITTRAAKEVGLNYVQVVSSSESIERGLMFARLLGQQLQQKKQMIAYYQALLQHKKYSLLLYHYHTGKVTFSDIHHAAVQKLQRKIHFETMKTQVIQEAEEIYIVEKQPLSESECLLIITQKPFLSISGAVAERETEHASFSSFDLFYRITEAEPFFNMIASYSVRDDIVFITGERGTGIDYVAELVHRQSLYPNDTWYEIDCAKVTDKELRQWLENTTSFFYENNKVIHWKNIGALSLYQLNQLFSAIRDTALILRNKIILSFYTKEEKQLSRKQVEGIFEESLSLLHIELAPLRKRREYIPNLATIYINKLNRQYERQVVGFDKMTLRELELYHWPGNYGEFKRVIKESFYLAESSYIKQAQLQQVIKMDLTTESGEKQKWVGYQKGEPLDEIVSHLIQTRLKETGMNKTKLAEELGISRTTLWRYIR